MTTPKQRFLIPVAALIVLGGAFCARPHTTQAAPATDKMANSHKLDGVWRQVASREWKTGSAAPALTDIPKEQQTELKFITGNHFIWYIYDPATKKIAASLTGTCTLNGNSYQETPQHYLGNGMDAMLDKAQSFTVKVGGNQVHMAGTLTFGGAQSTSLQIEEVWERVK